MKKVSKVKLDLRKLLSNIAFALRLIVDVVKIVLDVIKLFID